MVSEQLLRDAGWPEELIAAVKQADIESRDQTPLSVGTTEAIIDLSEKYFTESTGIDLSSASNQEFAWPRFS